MTKKAKIWWSPNRDDTGFFYFKHSPSLPFQGQFHFLRILLSFSQNPCQNFSFNVHCRLSDRDHYNAWFFLKNLLNILPLSIELITPFLTISSCLWRWLSSVPSSSPSPSPSLPPSSRLPCLVPYSRHHSPQTLSQSLLMTALWGRQFYPPQSWASNKLGLAGDHTANKEQSQDSNPRSWFRAS